MMQEVADSLANGGSDAVIGIGESIAAVVGAAAAWLAGWIRKRFGGK